VPVSFIISNYRITTARQMKKSNFIIIGFVVLACLSLTFIVFKKETIFSSPGKAAGQEEVFIKDHYGDTDSTVTSASVKLSGESTENSTGLQ